MTPNSLRFPCDNQSLFVPNKAKLIKHFFWNFYKSRGELYEWAIWSFNYFTRDRFIWSNCVSFLGLEVVFILIMDVLLKDFIKLSYILLFNKKEKNLNWYFNTGLWTIIKYTWSHFSSWSKTLLLNQTFAVFE